jgi:hypothetical protein
MSKSFRPALFQLKSNGSSRKPRLFDFVTRAPSVLASTWPSNFLDLPSRLICTLFTALVHARKENIRNWTSNASDHRSYAKRLAGRK